jgi:hypothetical protein
MGLACAYGLWVRACAQGFPSMRTFGALLLGGISCGGQLFFPPSYGLL